MASEGSKKICITSKRFAETRSPACEHCSNAHQSSFCQFLLPLATTTTTGAPPTVGHHDWSEKNYKRESFINLLNHQVETIEMIWLIGCIIAKLYHGPDIASMSWSLSGSMFWTIGSLRLIFFGIPVYTTPKPEAPLSSETMCSVNSYLIKCNQYDVYSTK